LDVKSRPSVQQLVGPQTVSLPEKWVRLLKELRHTVKQKNPNTEKRIKIPARNKGGDSSGKPGWPSGHRSQAGDCHPCGMVFCGGFSGGGASLTTG
jgi:hypothetical protein